eukprot:TRINITY_DN689_c0_g1_i3.p1 TRINITY_DN689_c0_g1~~TRINITY_DN689_c0_g1_i3.p1  ORF type:complete len:835 (-),score=228.94 TRINITY_DN689_c0_g1_i3:285-2789(-)
MTDQSLGLGNKNQNNYSPKYPELSSPSTSGSPTSSPPHQNNRSTYYPNGSNNSSDVTPPVSPPSKIENRPNEMDAQWNYYNNSQAHQTPQYNNNNNNPQLVRANSQNSNMINQQPQRGPRSMIIDPQNHFLGIEKHQPSSQQQQQQQQANPALSNVSNHQQSNMQAVNHQPLFNVYQPVPEGDTNYFQQHQNVPIPNSNNNNQPIHQQQQHQQQQYSQQVPNGMYVQPNQNINNNSGNGAPLSRTSSNSPNFQNNNVLVKSESLPVIRSSVPYPKPLISQNSYNPIPQPTTQSVVPVPPKYDDRAYIQPLQQTQQSQVLPQQPHPSQPQHPSQSQPQHPTQPQHPSQLPQQQPQQQQQQYGMNNHMTNMHDKSPQNANNNNNPDTVLNMNNNNNQDSYLNQNTYDDVFDNQNYPQNNNSGTKIVSSNLQVEGNVKARGYFTYSDLRLKTDIEELVDALSIVTQLYGKKYNWKKDGTFEDSRKGHKVIGLIAQEVYRVIPEVVSEDSDGILSVNYVELVPVLINAFNEHLKNENEYKDLINDELSELKKCTSSLEATRAINDQMVSKNIEQLTLVVSALKTKLERKKTGKFNPVASYKSLPRGAKITLVVLSIMLVLALTGITVLLSLPSNELERWTKNRIHNPSFEFFSPLGEQAVYWTAENWGYNMLYLTDYENQSYTILGPMPHDDMVPDPVVPYDGNVVLRLGSHEHPIGTERIYAVSQNILFPEGSLTPTTVNFSAWCMSKYMIESPSTHAYVMLQPVFMDNTTAWETRLMYTYGYESWEYMERVIELDKDEQRKLVGLIIKIELVTDEDSIFYCDMISLRMKHDDNIAY